MKNFAGETVNGVTFEIDINEAMRATYKINGKKVSCKAFWKVRKGAGG